MSDTLLVGAGWWTCALCSFRRYYATDQGALHGVARHMKEQHATRASLPTCECGTPLCPPKYGPGARECFDCRHERKESPSCN